MVSSHPTRRAATGWPQASRDSWPVRLLPARGGAAELQLQLVANKALQAAGRGRAPLRGRLTMVRSPGSMLPSDNTESLDPATAPRGGASGGGGGSQDPRPFALSRRPARCEDAWARSHPAEVIDAKGHSCAWARARRACAQHTAECNATCGGCSPSSHSAAAAAAAAAAADTEPFGGRTDGRASAHQRGVYRLLRLQVHGIRAPSDPLALSMQLAELRLFAGGEELRVASVTAIGADGVPVHPPSHATDSNPNTKWSDASVLTASGVSTLEITLDPPREVSAYEMIAAADLPCRDPTRWVLWGWEVSSRGWELLDAQMPYASLPPSRLSSYGRMHLAAKSHAPKELDAAPTCGEAVAATSALNRGGSAGPVVLYGAGNRSVVLEGEVEAEGGLIPSLGVLDSQLRAMRMPARVAAVIVYEDSSMAGRAHHFPNTAPGARCAMPTAVGAQARSLRVVLRSDAATIILRDGAAGSGATASTAVTFSSVYTYGDVAELPTLDASTPRYLGPQRAARSPNAPIPTAEAAVEVAAEAACLGSRVSGLLVFSEPSHRGSALLLWRNVTPGAVEGRGGDVDGGDVGGGSGEQVCTPLPAGVRSLKVVGDYEAVLWHSAAGGAGNPAVVRRSLPFLSATLFWPPSTATPTTPAAPATPATAARSTPDAGEPADDAPDLRLAVCVGRALRALEAFDASGWSGRAEMHAPGSCPSRTTHRARGSRGAASLRLHPRELTAQLAGPVAGASSRRRGGWRLRVISSDSAQLGALSFRVARLRFGRGLRGVVLHSSPKYEGARLLFTHTSRGVRSEPTGDSTVMLPLSWTRRGAVGSMQLLWPCGEPGIVCGDAVDGGADGGAGGDRAGTDGVRAPRVMEYAIPERGETLPFRSPARMPAGIPAPVADGRYGKFHVYNPALLSTAGELLIVARYSNYNFCTSKKNFESNLAAAHGSLMSFVLIGSLNLSSWSLAPPGWRMWDDVNARFPAAHLDYVSGPEDPRAVSSHGEAVLLVASWESTKVQWVHMLRLPMPTAGGGDVEAAGAGGGGGRGARAAPAAGGPLPARPPRSWRLEVSRRHELPLQPWFRQFRRRRAKRVREKNWAPFSWRGALYVEYSLEPRLVLGINEETGEATPVFPVSSSPSVRAWSDKLGPISGGPPSVHLPAHGVYLGLAHVKLFRKKGGATSTSSMVYKHFWYTFEAQPPFRILGTSLPFTLPTQLDTPPSVQFATGLAVSPSSHQIVVSYGELDCYATLARFALEATLNSISSRRLAEPTPLLSALVLLPALDASESGGGSGGGGTSIAPLRRLLPMVRLLSNVTSFNGESDDPRSRRRRNREARLYNIPPPRAVTLLLTERCEVPAEAEREIEAAGVRVGCAACSWDAVGERRSAERDAEWAARVFGEASCRFGPRRGDVPPALLPVLAGVLRGARRLESRTRDAICLALCGVDEAGEIHPLCRCALLHSEASRATTSALGPLANVIRLGQHQLIAYAGVAPLSRAAPCLARTLSPAAVLAALPVASGGEAIAMEVPDDAALADVALARSEVQARALVAAGVAAVWTSSGLSSEAARVVDGVRAMVVDRAAAGGMAAVEVSDHLQCRDVYDSFLGTGLG